MFSTQRQQIWLSADYRTARHKGVPPAALQSGLSAAVLHGHGAAALGHDGLFQRCAISVERYQYAVDVRHPHLLPGNHYSAAVCHALQDESAVPLHPLHTADPIGRRFPGAPCLSFLRNRGGPPAAAGAGCIPKNAGPVCPEYLTGRDV